MIQQPWNVICLHKVAALPTLDRTCTASTLHTLCIPGGTDGNHRPEKQSVSMMRVRRPLFLRIMIWYLSLVLFEQVFAQV